jgi:hypothetical protein
MVMLIVITTLVVVTSLAKKGNWRASCEDQEEHIT